MLFIVLFFILAPKNSMSLNVTELSGNSLGNPCTDKNNLVLAPGVFTAGGTNRACVSRFYPYGPARVQLALYTEDRLAATASRELPPGDGGCLDITAPQLPNMKADLFVSIVYTDVQCVWERRLPIRIASGRMLIIQTERARYRPGDTVRARMIALKPDLAPSHGMIEEAWLEGPRGAWEGARVSQWLRVRTRLGLAQLQYQLDALAPPGKWTFRAKLEDGSQGSSTFWVNNYELPPFQLSVRHAPRVLRTSERLVWTVCVRYPWSEAVEGMLVIRLRGAGGGGTGVRTAVQLRAPKACHRHAVAAKRVGLHSPNPPEVLVADFSFQEEGTRIWQNTTVVSQVVDKAITLEFLTKRRTVISPGLPYKLKVKATRWDDKPAPNEKVLVCRYPALSLDDIPEAMSQDSKICAEGLTDNTGVARVMFPAVNNEASFYKFEVQLSNDSTTTSSLRVRVRDGAVQAALGPLKPDSWSSRTLVPLYINTHITTPITVHFVVITRGGIIYRWGATTQSPTSNTADQIDITPCNGKCNYYGYNPEAPAQTGEQPGHEDISLKKCFHMRPKRDLNNTEMELSMMLGDLNDSEFGDKDPNSISMNPVDPWDLTLNEQNDSSGEKTPMLDLLSSNEQTTPNFETPEPTRVFKVRNHQTSEEPKPESQTLPKESTEVKYESTRSETRMTSAWNYKKPSTLPDVTKPRDVPSTTPCSLAEATVDMIPRVMIENVTMVTSDALLNRRLKVMLPIKVSHQMCPDSHLIAYFYYKGELVSASKHFEMDECFANKAEATWLTRQALPGSTVSLQVTTPGPALCALTALDTASKWTQPLTPTKDLLMNSLRRLIDSHRNLTEYDAAGECFLNADTPDTPTRSIDLTSMWLASAGIRLLGGGSIREPLKRCSNQHPGFLLTEESPPRTDFSEAWLWRLLPVGMNGTGIISAHAPDSITRFEASATCLSKTGIAVSPPAVLQVFREFFIHADGPKHLRRGDTAIIRYRIFNYLYEPLSVKIHTDPQLEVPGGPETVCVGARSSAARRARITPRSTGYLRLSIKAVAINDNSCPNVTSTAIVSDEVIIGIAVDPEGIPVHEQKSILLCGRDNSFSNSEVEWTWPPLHAVPGTEALILWTVGDITGPLLADADSLVTIPRGCGEQNMAQLATNLLSLSQLDKTSISAFTAREHVARGFTRQLQYIHPSGGFSAFGPSDVTSSTWLTAFAVRHLRKAHQLLWPNVQYPSSLIRAERWLINQQMENGCFRNEGQVFHRELRGGLNEEGEIASVALTAYVITSLIESTATLPYRVLRNSFSCLRALPPAKSQTPTRVYAQALLAYAFMRIEKYEEDLRNTNKVSMLRHVGLEENEGVRQVLELLKVAKRSGNYVWWETSSLSTSIEATSYALLALHASPASVQSRGASGEAAAALRWLASHRTSTGGFVSTQDTLVALEALIAWSASSPTTHLNVTAQCEDITKTVTLLPGSRIPDVIPLIPGDKLRVNVEGVGCALVQATRSYNTLSPPPNHDKLLSVQVNVHTDGPFNCDTNVTDTCFCAAVVEVCVMWSKDFPEMALLEVTLPGGYGADARLLYSQLNKHGSLVRRIELSPTSSRATLYLAPREGGGGAAHQCLALHAVGPRARTRPAHVHLHDYYAPDHNDTQIYTIPEECPPRISHRQSSEYHSSDNLFDQAKSSNSDEILINNEFSVEDLPDGIPLEDPLYENLTKKEKIEEEEKTVDRTEKYIESTAAKVTEGVSYNNTKADTITTANTSKLDQIITFDAKHETSNSSVTITPTTIVTDKTLPSTTVSTEKHLVNKNMDTKNYIARNSKEETGSNNDNTERVLHNKVDTRKYSAHIPRQNSEEDINQHVDKHVFKGPIDSSKYSLPNTGEIERYNEYNQKKVKNEFDVMDILNLYDSTQANHNTKVSTSSSFDTLNNLDPSRYYNPRDSFKELSDTILNNPIADHMSPLDDVRIRENDNDIFKTITNDETTPNSAQPTQLISASTQNVDNPKLTDFHVIDSDVDLDVPTGVEGPVPTMVLPPPNFIPSPLSDHRNLKALYTSHGPYFYFRPSVDYGNRMLFSPHQQHSFIVPSGDKSES